MNTNIEIGQVETLSSDEIAKTLNWLGIVTYSYYSNSYLVNLLCQVLSGTYQESLAKRVLNEIIFCSSEDDIIAYYQWGNEIYDCLPLFNFEKAIDHPLEDIKESTIKSINTLQLLQIDDCVVTCTGISSFLVEFESKSFVVKIDNNQLTSSSFEAVNAVKLAAINGCINPYEDNYDPNEDLGNGYVASDFM